MNSVTYLNFIPYPRDNSTNTYSILLIPFRFVAYFSDGRKSKSSVNFLVVSCAVVYIRACSLRSQISRTTAMMGTRYTPRNLTVRSRQNTTHSRHKPPVSPFSAHYSRSRFNPPVHGTIAPPVFGIFDGSPTCAACYKMQLKSWAPVRVWRDLPNRIISQVQK